MPAQVLNAYEQLCRNVHPRKAVSRSRRAPSSGFAVVTDHRGPWWELVTGQQGGQEVPVT